MNMPQRASPWHLIGPWEGLALSLWGGVVAVLLAIAVWAPAGKGSIYPDYHWAFGRWQQGTDTYANGARDNELHNYRYGPSVTALLAPLGLLPLKVGEVVWRFANLLVFMGGLALWARDVLPWVCTRSRLALLLLLVFPLAIGNIHNGQANLLILGLLLGAVSAVARARWNVAALCIVAAGLFKVYPLALGLLLAALYPRRLLPRLVFALGLGLLLPFLLHEPEYVWRQYALWFDYLCAEDRTHLPLDCNYVDVQLLCKVWLAPIGTPTYRGLEVAAGAILAALCLAGRRVGWDQRRLLTFVSSSSLCWMTALGPATEPATYCLLAPAAAWAVLSVCREPAPPWLRGIVLASCFLLLTSQMAAWFPGLYKPYRFLGPQPVGALLLLVGIGASAFRLPASAWRFAVVSLTLVGCALASGRLLATEPTSPPQAGVVFVVGGIGGLDFVGGAAVHVLPKAGLPHEICDFFWQHGKGHFLKDLQDTEYLVQKAGELAADVRRYKAEHPDRPVYLIGKSAGAGLVLFAAEMLPPASVERIILLSAAVSNTFDLRPALRATRGEIVSFHSRHDWLILGLGTRQFGTVDRVNGSSAGLYGFVKPAHPSPEDAQLYSRLVQIPWSLEMISGLYLGGHLGTSMPGFLKREVTPWLK